jgi:hypothetical protein
MMRLFRVSVSLRVSEVLVYQWNQCKRVFHLRLNDAHARPQAAAKNGDKRKINSRKDFFGLDITLNWNLSMSVWNRNKVCIIGSRTR